MHKIPQTRDDEDFRDRKRDPRQNFGDRYGKYVQIKT
jgi:hypothetical protein